MRSSSLVLVGATLALVGASAGAQSRPAKVFMRYNRPLRSASLDLATGTFSHRPAVHNKSASTVVDFSNGDLSGFVGVDSGNSFCEWFDAGIKGFANGKSDMMSDITFSYCSAVLDPRSGGPGGAVRLGFYEGYEKGGVTPTTAVTTLTLTGLPANTASSSFFGGFSCYFIRVTFSGLIAFADGPIGYSWTFVDTGSDGTLAGTWPYLSCVVSCSGARGQLDDQGMTDAIDEYCPPGVLRSTFTFGTTSGSFSSMAMSIEEKRPDLPPGLDAVPEGVHNAVGCFDTGKGPQELSDVDFAKALKKALKDNKFHSLVLSFAPCYAGGFVNQIHEVFGKDITRPVFAMSPTRWNQQNYVNYNPQFRLKDESEGTEATWSLWYWKHHNGAPFSKTFGYVFNANRAEKLIFDSTKNQTEVKLFTPNAQHLALNDGADIRIGSPKSDGPYTFATDLKALVVENAQRHPGKNIADIRAAWNTLGRQLDGLKKSWSEDLDRQRKGGAQGKKGADGRNEDPILSRITFLFENGKPLNPNNTPTKEPKKVQGDSSRAQILESIAALNPDNVNTQIFVYLGMHGIEQKVNQALVRPRALPSADNTIQFPALEPFELADLTDPGNSTGPLLELQVHGTGGNQIPTGYQIYFNGVPVVPYESSTNAIPGGAFSTTLLISIDPGLVNSGGNTVWMPDSNPAAAPIWVHASFTAGAIASRVAEPSGVTSH